MFTCVHTPECSNAFDSGRSVLDDRFCTSKGPMEGQTKCLNDWLKSSDRLEALT